MLTHTIYSYSYGRTAINNLSPTGQLAITMFSTCLRFLCKRGVIFEYTVKKQLTLHCHDYIIFFFTVCVEYFLYIKTVADYSVQCRKHISALHYII